jgi:hypothetical protein
LLLLSPSTLQKRRDIKDEDQEREQEQSAWMTDQSGLSPAATRRESPVEKALVPSGSVSIIAPMPRNAPTSTFEIHSSNFASHPGQLFYSTQIPVCLWFFGKNEPAGKCRAVCELELALAA